MRPFLIAATSLSLIAAPSAAVAQRAGQLIAADPVVDTPSGTQAWRIRYWTSDGSGRPREVTGMVVAPREAIPARPRDVLAWTHGAWGQNPKDHLIAPRVTRAHVRALCRAGARRKFVTINGEGHATSANDSAASTLAWIADRFAGRPAPKDCGGA